MSKSSLNNKKNKVNLIGILKKFLLMCLNFILGICVFITAWFRGEERKLDSYYKIRNFGIKAVKVLINVLKILFIMFSFFIMDYGLRLIFKENLSFKDYSYVPNLFTLCWILIFTAVISMFPRKTGRIIYGVLYFTWAAYIIIQRGYYLIFNKFLFINDFIYSSEGMHYASFVKEILDSSFIIFIAVTVAVGIAGVFLFPGFKNRGFIKYLKLTPAFVGVIGLFVIPAICYGGQEKYKEAWNAWESPGFEYDKFSSPVSDMELTGVYHFVARDIQLKVKNKIRRNNEEKTAEIENYFKQRETNETNAMTGIFEGKNVIIVMMESLDDWVISQENTPTIWSMMQNGINFTNMYTPLYTTGCTFNTEFSFNTGNFPYSNGTPAYSVSDNGFSESLANLFTEKGYTANSFHMGNPEFYKRGIMHKAFGFESYNSYYDYVKDGDRVEIDTFLPRCDELYNKMIENQPFMDFVITYTGHLPYNESNFLSTYALEKYPQYNKADRSYEVNALSAQARITDDMFTELIARLEEDGILDNTVIIGYTDHYSYGIADNELLQELTEAAGSEIPYKTPAFIYCKGYEHIENNKIIQTIDFVPTISNMFGLNCPEVLGRDIFDDSYSGYVVFPNNDWLTDKAYYLNGELKYNNGMTQNEIDEMNEFVQKFYNINNYILDTDYYAKPEE